MIGHSLRRSFLSFVLPGLEYCSVVWCSAADSHLTGQRYWTAQESCFLPGGVLEYSLAHRRSIVVLCTLKFMSNPMHPLSGALPLPYVPARITRGLWLLISTCLRLLAVEFLSTAEPLCSSQCLFGTTLVSLCLMVWGWRVSKEELIN